MSRGAVVVYWDSSAVLSVLFRDRHSDDAARQARRPGLHLLSTLAWAEVCAVIGRLARERVLGEALAEAARHVVAGGPWRRTTASPHGEVVRELAARWALSGPDLWHLAAAKTLQNELPELRVLSYDERFATAARGEGLI